jgi:hypothetical protein
VVVAVAVVQVQAVVVARVAVEQVHQTIMELQGHQALLTQAVVVVVELAVVVAVSVEQVVQGVLLLVTLVLNLTLAVR